MRLLRRKNDIGTQRASDTARRHAVADAVQAIALIVLTVSAFLLTAFATVPLVRLVAVPIKRLLGVSQLTISTSALDAIQQVIALVIMGVAWHVTSQGKALVPRRLKTGIVRTPRGWKGIALAIVSILLMAFGAYMLTSFVYGLVVSVMPAAEAAHEAHTRDAGVVSPVPMLSIAILAPLVEETICRGLLLDFSLRLFASKAYAKDVPETHVSAVRFWLANLLQALIFGALHANVAQSAYAFPIGLLLGWIYWRTGKLRYNMLCHFVINSNGYFVGTLVGAIGNKTYVTVAWYAFVFGVLMFHMLTKRPKTDEPEKVQGSASKEEETQQEA